MTPAHRGGPDGAGTAATLRVRRLVRSEARLGSAGRGRRGGDTAAALGARLRPSAAAARAGRMPFPLASPTWPGSLPRPDPTPDLGTDYDTAWSRRYPVRLARALLIDNVARPVAKLVASPLVQGLDALEHLEGPVIFAANHASHVDTPLVVSCLPLRFRHRTVVAAAADYFFDRRWKAGAWSFLLAAIPIERSRINRTSTDLAMALIADGWNLVIFPEGGRTPDGWGQPFHAASAAYLATRTGRPVVPVHLDGTRDILPKGRGGIRRVKTTVTFGTPLWPTPEEDARKLGRRIEASVATLADEAGSDWWTARRRAATGTTPSLRGPEVAAWRRAWALPVREHDDDDPTAPPTPGRPSAWPRRP